MNFVTFMRAGINEVQKSLNADYCLPAEICESHPSLHPYYTCSSSYVTLEAYHAPCRIVVYQPMHAATQIRWMAAWQSCFNVMQHLFDVC